MVSLQCRRYWCRGGVGVRFYDYLAECVKEVK